MIRPQIDTPATRGRCLIATSHGRATCASCGVSWDAREAHVCPDRRALPPSDAPAPRDAESPHPQIRGIAA